MRPRIYIDTSVVGGYFDEEFRETTELFFQQFQAGDFLFVVSDLLDLELLNAPPRVRDLLSDYRPDFFERAAFTEEAETLANQHITEKVVGRTSLTDCRHIALATLSRVDVLASWNFKHIVNIQRINGYNSVNLRLGYQMLEIRSPKDLLTYEND